MADFNPVPPPPPPPRMNKPVPPPPPSGKAPAAPMNAPMAAPSMPPINMPPSTAVKPPSMAPMPGRPGAAPNSVDQRMQDMERRFQEQDGAKKEMEAQINDLQHKLKDEHEKLMTQSIRAKEEEALAGRVEQQLREMQDKLRREKYEQELHDSRSKAESQLKELERRMVDERETWMVALKNQLKERETLERETEQGLNRRIQDFEKRYQAEKTEWGLALRQKDDDMAQVRRQFQFDLEKLQEELAGKVDEQDELRETMIRERRAVEQQSQSDLRTLQAQLETQLREAGTWKAQVAMLQSQIMQTDLVHKEEKNRWQGQLDQMISQQKDERSRWQAQIRRLEEDHQDARARFESQGSTKEEEMKREFARRDADRAKHWEDTINQMRSEKDVLRQDLKLREEALAKAQIRLSEVQRDVEVERSEWQTGQERIRRAAKEEALRELPVAFQLKLDTEKKVWEETRREMVSQHEEAKKSFAMRLETYQAQVLKERTAMDAQHRVTVQELKVQLTKALDTHTALNAKLGIEERRVSQNKEALQAAETMITTLSQNLEAAKKAADVERSTREEDACHELAILQDAAATDQGRWEKQTKELLQRLAQLQLREESGRLDLSQKIQSLTTEHNAARAEIETLKTQLTTAIETVKQEQQHAERISDNLKTAAHNIDALESHKSALEQELSSVRSDVQKLMQAQVEWKAKEKDYEGAQLRLREAFTTVKTEMAQGQSERSAREADWAQKEAAWKTLQAEWESKPKLTVVEAGGGVAAGPEAAKALTAIRQQMQEMQTLLTWLRPKKALGKAA